MSSHPSNHIFFKGPDTPKAEDLQSFYNEINILREKLIKIQEEINTSIDQSKETSN